ncbi:MAG: preprotein translocase subunit SecA [Ruminococcus sp.]|jgi:preprotein translocase subunit SecA|nr:preprotein translocase subunit SecA [Ruminococcus sp.]
MGLFDGLFGSYSKRELAKLETLKNQVLALDEEYGALSDAELKAKTPEFRERLTTGERVEDLMVEALATAREAAWRVLAKKPFPVQIVGAIVLHQGRIAEMKTGEGKTLVACLASYLNALDSRGVHVVTVNDYLAKFQSEEMGKVYNFLGVTIGCVVHELNNEQRRAAYNCDITYGTNNEFGFDYLRDNMVIYASEKVQREHNFAIVDEVDSILIDEARTPLIISGRGDKSTDLYVKVNKFAISCTEFRIAESNERSDQDEEAEDKDYIVDEKAKTATITRKGVKRAEKYFGIENLYDAEHSTLLHHINQALKAHGTMTRDVDYVVKDGEVVIVDEFTGRLMEGRRYSDGLHQAIEAKEGVKVERESKTLASITFQNYFRLYRKLSGMTGTAMTEEEEFKEIYKLDVIAVPTNKPVKRTDHHDSVFKTEKGKFAAVIDQIVACHEKGQPVLVGTVNIDKSEHLSKLLSKKGVKHNVLNAKQHAKEAEIVAQAGTYGAVTIATNMAGRGTDIILGGNAEFKSVAELKKRGIPDFIISQAISYSETDNKEILEARELYHELFAKENAKNKELAQKVVEVGGLFIIGTERHESRRIDNQLRGRSGRQGDPGESRFFISLEDDLMRIFGGERLQNMMDTLNVDEETPIEARMLTRVIESSQKKVEARNFGIRKNILNYDDVMSNQRKIIYTQRNQVLNNEDIHESILKMLKELISDGVNKYLLDDNVHDDWNLVGLRDHFMGLFTIDSDFRYSTEELAETYKKDIIEMLTNRALDFYDKKEQKMGTDVLREMERVVLLKVVDHKWMAHIDDMDELRKGISLRSLGHKNPVVEYRFESFEMFDEMIDAIREETIRILFTLQVDQQKDAPKRERVLEPVETPADSSGGTTTRRTGKKIGRNEPCPCGSGKKYKNCCGRGIDLK